MSHPVSISPLDLLGTEIARLRWMGLEMDDNMQRIFCSIASLDDKKYQLETV